MTDSLHVSLFDHPVGDLNVHGSLRAPEDWRFA